MEKTHVLIASLSFLKIILFSNPLILLLVRTVNTTPPPPLPRLPPPLECNGARGKLLTNSVEPPQGNPGGSRQILNNGQTHWGIS